MIEISFLTDLPKAMVVGLDKNPDIALNYKVFAPLTDSLQPTPLGRISKCHKLDSGSQRKR